uniref:Uncharacterized protein n=1 Tax=Anguilla anguilla TaxID=7936 RepID=A0A0E9TK42_ANGAN
MRQCTINLLHLYCFHKYSRVLCIVP